MAGTVILLPLLGAMFGTLTNRVLGVSGVKIFIISNMIVASLLSYSLLVSTTYSQMVIVYAFSDWLDFFWGGATWGLWIDSITALMTITVCIVSAAVHVYSCYYMADDPHLKRFLVYLSLFTFFMLFLVSSENLIQLFFGWEGVGLCSYLLINFWYTRPQANKAALKAILVNRIGDCGLLFAIVLIINQFGSVHLQPVFAKIAYSAPTVPVLFGFSTMDFICLFLFIGVTAKSAQIGLHTWLPDAMEGPTPVSALIHAATMVTAGIYLMIRVAPIFECSASILTFVTVVGGATALFAASVALAQHDLKKIIAYSTCSQLGYMVMACGISHFSLALFHLINHAFFKALFFLGAGAVIHCFSGEQDIRKMGGLRNIFPEGLATMLTAAAALSGLPFLAGFYSKDFILGSLLAQNSVAGSFIWFVGILAAVCTSIYSVGLIYFVFGGTPRGPYSQYRHIHSIPFLATGPMLLLGGFSVVSGFLLKDLLVGPGSALYDSSLVQFSHTALVGDSVEWIPLHFKLFASSIGFIGFIVYGLIEYCGLALYRYPFGWFSCYKFLFWRWYWDSLYNEFIAWPVYRHSYLTVYRVFDKGFVEGAGLNFFTGAALLLARRMAFIQSGLLGQYLIWLVISFLIFWELGCTIYYL